MPDSIGDLIAKERWKLTTIGVAFAIGSALETGLVVAQWTGTYSDQKMAEIGQVCAALDAGGSQTAEAACLARPYTALAGLPK